MKVWLPVGTNVDEEEVKKIATNSMLTLTASKFYKFWPRHRWLGWSEALAPIVLGESINEAFSSTYPSFLEAQRAKEPNALMPPAAEAEAAEEPAAAGGAAAAEAEANAPADAEENAEHRAADEGVGAGDDKKVQASKASVAAAKFWATKPGSKLRVTFQILEPMARLLEAQIYAASDEWEQKQLVAEAVAMDKGERGGSRLYEVLVAAYGTLENLFHKKIVELMTDAALWDDLVLPWERTVAMNHLIFRLLSACDSVVQETLDDIHDTNPIKAFKILDPRFNQDILFDENPCKCDP